MTRPAPSGNPAPKEIKVRLPSRPPAQPSKPSSVALFTSSLSGGGAEHVFAQLANAFVQNQVAVDLILFQKKGPYLDKLDPRIRVIDLKRSHGLFSIFPMARYLRQNRPPILISTLESPNLVAGILKRLGFLPGLLIINVQNMEDDLIAKYGFLKKNIFRFLYPFAVRAADHLIAPSKGVRDLYFKKKLGLPHSKISVIYNAIVDDHLQKSMRIPIREKWFHPGLKPFILSVGRLEAQKDQATLLRAFALVRKQKSINLFILGEGSERKNLEKLAEDLGVKRDLWMPGFQTNPYSFMRQASVFALSSKHEGLANVLVEALACGAPVVSTDCPSGPREVLENGKWGELVPVGDDRALAQTILRTLRSPGRRERRGAVEKFKLKRIIQEYFKLFRSLSPKALP